ncbi:metal-sulfur cluster assembly factor [Flavihumibacter petaseus]|uniref:MIP18 family-like domain-containing protein n=1 Tax=Flavihumibacter petaseus NBRC 106054 TaxID=1220578 RepID=A0A0E9MYT5_9BACT|nr:metal-sulfur cluster assembly factor [Flavihumibacter petaseus]GAO42693.1 hypothetical protein FPE01S_01_17090 [Flavihumibacter petaseus NBRC 106054]
MDVITNNTLRCTIALAALESVVDPELGLNVVDLGLICQVDFDDAAGKIFVQMMLTARFCPMGESLINAIARVMEATFPFAGITVLQTFDPPWDHSRISPEGKRFLNR